MRLERSVVLSRCRRRLALPVTTEALPELAERQRPQRGIERRRSLFGLELMVSHRRRRISDRIQRIVSFLAGLATAQPEAPAGTDFRPPIPIANLGLQNPMKQRPPFRFVARTVSFDQLQHGLLYKVERLVIVSRGDLRHSKRAAFDPG